MTPIAKAAHTAILEFIDRQTEPSKMSKADALDVLENLDPDLYGRIECLKEEMADE